MGETSDFFVRPSTVRGASDCLLQAGRDTGRAWNLSGDAEIVTDPPLDVIDDRTWWGGFSRGESNSDFGNTLGFDAVGRAYDEQLAVVHDRLRQLHLSTEATGVALKSSAETYENNDHL
jgi:hypothetical protein